MDSNKLKRDRAVIILSFDDGREDQFRIAQYLQEHELPAVFNITTGYLRGDCSKLTKISPMSVEDVRWIAGQREFEIAGHGDLHENTVRDLAKGRENLLKLLRHENRYMKKEYKSAEKGVLNHPGFASPGSKMSPAFVRRHEQQIRKLGYSYVRTGSAVRTLRVFRLICRKIGRVVHLPFLFKIAYEESLVDRDEKFCFTSIPIMADTTLRETETIIDLAIHRNKLCVLMFHSVFSEGEIGYNELWTWDQKKFERLVHYLREHQEKGELLVLNNWQYLSKMT